MLSDVAGCVTCHHLVQRDYDEALNTSDAERGWGVGWAENPVL